MRSLTAWQLFILETGQPKTPEDIDLIGTILLPALLFITNSPVLFGWAKPVPVNPLHFSNIRRGELLVSLAGVGANFGLAIIAAVLFHISAAVLPTRLLLQLLFFTANINLILGVFNLLPIPPLDGSKVLMSQLPYNLARQFMAFERYGILLFLALWFIRIGNTSILALILSTAVGFLRGLLGF